MIIHCFGESPDTVSSNGSCKVSYNDPPQQTDACDSLKWKWIAARF